VTGEVGKPLGFAGRNAIFHSMTAISATSSAIDKLVASTGSASVESKTR
jgi:hypothetical protein